MQLKYIFTYCELGKSIIRIKEIDRSLAGENDETYRYTDECSTATIGSGPH